MINWEQWEEETREAPQKRYGRAIIITLMMITGTLPHTGTFCSFFGVLRAMQVR